MTDVITKAREAFEKEFNAAYDEDDFSAWNGVFYSAVTNPEDGYPHPIYQDWGAFKKGYCQAAEALQAENAALKAQVGQSNVRPHRCQIRPSPIGQ